MTMASWAVHGTIEVSMGVVKMLSTSATISVTTSWTTSMDNLFGGIHRQRVLAPCHRQRQQTKP